MLRSTNNLIKQYRNLSLTFIDSLIKAAIDTKLSSTRHIKTGIFKPKQNEYPEMIFYTIRQGFITMFVCVRSGPTENVANGIWVN